MANPEAGFFGQLFNAVKKIFTGEGERKAVQQAQKKEQPREIKEERKEKKERAEEIIKELDRVTPQHPAFEILQGVKLDPKTIKDHPELGELLLDIVHTVNADPTQYHNPEWLKKKLGKFNIFVNALAAKPNEANKVSAIQDNVEKLYRASQKDRREDLVNQEVEKLKRGEESPTEGIAANTGEQVNNWTSQQTLDNLPTEVKGIFEAAKRAIESASNPNDKKAAYVKLYQDYINKKRELVSTIKPGNRNAVENYQKLQKTMEAVARSFTDEFPQEDKQIREASGWRGDSFEFNEHRIQTEAEYRDYYFYHIIENILYNQKTETHRDLYGLYEMSDMHKFFEIVRRMPEKDATGKSIGIKLATRYDILKNTIFQSHDMDYYCAHPQQDMKEFIGSTALFLNDYIDAGVQDPMIALAKRLYEQALLQIRDSHGGYIPREYLLYTEVKYRASKLDEMVETNLKQAIAAGQLYNVAIDKITGLPTPSMWNRKQIDPTKPYTLKDLYGDEPEQSDSWRRNLGELKIQAALKVAKGLSLVDQRMLEVIGKSKGTGTRYIMDNKPWTIHGFNSIPYEGIIRYIEPVIHYYGRYGLGMDISGAFFNMIVSDRNNYNWDPKHMQVLMKHYLDGEYEEAEKYAKEHDLGDIQTRLNAMDNPFGYSGMWGTMTGWRVGDSTAGFDDWEKDQAYAAAVKLVNIGDFFSAPKRESTFQKNDTTWAYIKAIKYFREEVNKELYEQCRTKYRGYLLDSEELRFREMAKRDVERRGTDPKDFDAEFEYNWRTQGEGRYRKELDVVWQDQLDEHKKPKKGSELLKMIMRLERAYKARVWVQTTMKAPLIVAREIETQYKKHGIDSKGPLRKKIIWELLGIDMDELELGTGPIMGVGPTNLTPTTIQEHMFDRITDVEGALTSLQQQAIKENRDLTDRDFDDAIAHLGEDSKKKQNYEYARQYWYKVQEAMFGEKKAVDYYEGLGIKNAKTKDKDGNDIRSGVRFHDINWEKIKNINIDADSINKSGRFIVEGLRTDLLNNKLIDRNYRHLFSTEDMGWEFLNINSLGSRNPVRRAGDLASHVQFGQAFEKYLLDYVQRPVGKVDDMVKALHEMWGLLSGDFDYVAADACARVAYSTGMIYRKADWAWKIPFGIGPIIGSFTETSISQKLHGRDRGVAWGPNDMLYWVQAVGSHILPKGRYSRFSGEEVMPQAEWTRALLGKRLGGTKFNATYEIANMAVFLATIITIYRAITAKSEEEED